MNPRKPFPLRRALATAALLSTAPAALAAQAAPGLIPVLHGDDGMAVSLDSASVLRSGARQFMVHTVVHFPEAAAADDGSRFNVEVDAEELDCAHARSRTFGSRLFMNDSLVMQARLNTGWLAVTPERRTLFDASCAVLGGSFAAALPIEAEMDAVDRLPQLTNVRVVQSALTHEYPPTKLAQNASGDVSLRFRVNREGGVDTATVTVLETTDADFAAAARRVVLRMRFTPAVIGREPVAVWVELPVAFYMQTTHDDYHTSFRLNPQRTRTNDIW